MERGREGGRESERGERCRTKFMVVSNKPIISGQHCFKVISITCLAYHQFIYPRNIRKTKEMPEKYKTQQVVTFRRL